MGHMEKTLNIYQRILAVMEDLDYIQKGSAKVNGMYRFVSHDQVTAAIHPLLVKHRLVIIPTVENFSQEVDGKGLAKTTLWIEVCLINVDNPQESITIKSVGQGVDSSDKGIGKAYSYAYKYALLKAFNLETGDDPDNDAKTVFKTKEKEVVQESKELAEKLIADFIKEIDSNLSDDDKSWCISYIKGYAYHYKKTISQSIRDYANHSKFIKDMRNWQQKKLKAA
jgi:hypothetical protein